jgi:hypothetical protein
VTRRHVTRFAALVAVASALAACSSPTDRVSVSARRVGAVTSDAGTARFSIRETSDNDFGGGPVRQDGEFDFANQNGTIRDLSDSQRGLNVSETIVDGAIYLPATLADFDGHAMVTDRSDPCFDKSWFVVPRSMSDGEDGRPGPFAPYPDPSRIIDTLKSSDAALVASGTEEIRGVPSTRYRVTTTAGRIDPRFRVDEAEHADLVALEIWTDSADRLRRARWVLRIRSLAFDPDHPSETTQEGLDTEYRQTTTIDMWDYGIDVTVVKPPDRDTCDFAEFYSRTMKTFD